jgi:hypothetical protein
VRWVEWKRERGKTLKVNIIVNTEQEIKFLRAVNVEKTRIQVENRKKAIAKRKKTKDPRKHITYLNNLAFFAKIYNRKDCIHGRVKKNAFKDYKINLIFQNQSISPMMFKMLPKCFKN